MSQDTALDTWVGKESAWAFQRLFTTAETHEFTHGIHPYPAKMVPQIARALIAKFSQKGDIVLDPFCGSGGVLVESVIAGRNGVGVEINPLAVLISKVATTAIDETKLRRSAEGLVKRVYLEAKGSVSTDHVPVHNVNHWFKPQVIKALATILNEIRREEDEVIRNLFLVTFSSTMYKVSNIRHKDNPYFARILHEDELPKHNPDTIKEFRNQLRRSVDAVASFSRKKDSSSKAEIIQGDSRNLSGVIDKKVDLVVTSPPYGEQPNTMDYTRFTRLALEWLEIENHSASLALGTTQSVGDLSVLSSPALDATLNSVKKKDENRAEQVASFLYDYHKCLLQLHEKLKSGRYLCVVIGDRTAGGIEVPNGVITAELGEHLGFERIEIVKRKMYLKALRSNVMKYENVVILRKS